MGLTDEMKNTLTSVGGGILNTAIGGLFSMYNQHKQREENQKDREFNAAEAQKQRDFEEQMYRQYESPMAQVNQRKNAGLNALDGVSSQSVGSGSTASANSSPLPNAQLSTQWMAELPMMAQQLRSAKLQNENQMTQNQIAVQELSIKTQEAIKSALEAGQYEEALRLQREELRASADYKHASAKKLNQEAERLLMENDNYRNFKETGGNEFQDISRLRQTEADLNESIKSLNSVKEDTEKQEQLTLASQAYKNYAEASLANLEAELAKKDLSTYDQRFLWEKEMYNLKAQAMRIARQKDNNELELQRLEIAYTEAMNSLDVDEDGNITGWAKFKDFMKACGSAVGLGVGAFMGTNVKGLFTKRTPIGFHNYK